MKIYGWCEFDGSDTDRCLNKTENILSFQKKRTILLIKSTKGVGKMWKAKKSSPILKWTRGRRLSLFQFPQCTFRQAYFLLTHYKQWKLDGYEIAPQNPESPSLSQQSSFSRMNFVNMYFNYLKIRSELGIRWLWPTTSWQFGALLKSKHHVTLWSSVQTDNSLNL